MGHVSGRSVSCPPPHPDGWFGREKSKPATLNLVKGSPVVPCDARPFPFWLSSLIAAVVLTLVAVGLRVWILPAILAVPEFDAPVIGITHAGPERNDPEATAPLRRPITKLPPPAPRALAPLQLPAAQLEIVEAPDALPEIEPYDPELLEELEVPFPVQKSEPDKKVAKVSPKPSPVDKNRPESKPRSLPKVTRSKGPSRPASVLRRYQPGYPQSARRDKVEGRVMLDVQINSNGRVGSVRVITSSGSPVLDSTAIAAVKRWSFSPAQKEGRPVSSQVHVPFRFSLK
jgi:TonB family protein